MGMRLRHLWEADGEDEAPVSTPPAATPPAAPANAAPPALSDADVSASVDDDDDKPLSYRPREHPGYVIVRNGRTYGSFTQKDLVRLVESGKIVSTDICRSIASSKEYTYEQLCKSLGVEDHSSPMVGSIPGVKGEIKNNQWGSFDANDDDSWEYVYDAANALLDRYYYRRQGKITRDDFTKIIAQVNAIKKLAGRWLNRKASKPTTTESVEAVRQAISELKAAEQYIKSLSEYGSPARRQARLVRLQTRQVLDALRDDNKEEIANGPFLDTKRAEEEGARDEDKDK